MVKGALIGFAIALAMLLPPVLHWITFPLGPLIGGFFGGSKARIHPTRAPIMGLLMGLFMVLPVVVILLVLSTVAEAAIPRGLRSILEVVALVVVLYTGVMGSIGAAIGGLVASRQEASSRVQGDIE